jgi:hypothetical protein
MILPGRTVTPAVEQEKRVNWKRVMQKYWMVDRQAHSPDSDSATAAANEHSPTAPSGRCSERVRLWRRRVLLKRGARMHAAMGIDGRICTLAMLDETGVVVSWYGRAGGTDGTADQVLDRHVSQFYIPEDVANKQPLHDLHTAIVEGRNSRQGWLRRADGTAFWGTAVIEAIVLRGGRLQGFSYMTSDSQGPSANVPGTLSLNLPHDEKIEASQRDMRVLAFPHSPAVLVRTTDADVHSRSSSTKESPCPPYPQQARSLKFSTPAKSIPRAAAMAHPAAATVAWTSSIRLLPDPAPVPTLSNCSPPAGPRASRARWQSRLAR